MNIRFVVLPPSKVNHLTARLARQVAKGRRTFFTVDNLRLLPHITLFIVETNRNKVPALTKQVQMSLKSVRKVSLKLKGYTAHPEGWLVMDLKRSPQLNALRKNLAKAATAYANGRPRLKNPYHPHITLTKYKTPDVAKLAKKELPRQNLSFKGGAIAITLYNKHSQVYKIIKQFKLS